MYTKEDIKKIIPEFLKSKFNDISLLEHKSLSKVLKEVNRIWPGLMAKTLVLKYWISDCQKEDFIDSLFCEHCGKFMNYREWHFPKYCSKECRLANHNWKKDSEHRKALEQKWLEQYGCTNPLGSKQVREKIKKTNLERYGSEHNWGRNSTVWNKIKQTNLEKYGTEYLVQSDHFKEKAKETMLEHYGVENPMKSEEVKNKVKQTNINRYGVPCTWNSGSPVRDKLIERCMQDYGVPYYCMTDKCKQSLTNQISHINKYFKGLLDSVSLESCFEYKVGWYSYDLYIDSLKLLIDINPSFTHSVTPGISNFKPKSKEYHYMRYKNAIVNGYRLLQIWDWDNIDKILANLKDRKSIGARQCELKKVSKKDATEFCNNYHYQNATKTLQYAYGLYFDNELIELMTFGKPRYNKNFQYELLRLCTKPEYSISGGASKLLSSFEKEINPESLVSYCDLSKFDGKVYENLGFEEIDYSISKHWCNYKGDKHFTDNLLRQLGADKLIGTNYGKGTNNEEIMLAHGFIEVYDAGQKTFSKKY